MFMSKMLLTLTHNRNYPGPPLKRGKGQKREGMERGRLRHMAVGGMDALAPYVIGLYVVV